MATKTRGGTLGGRSKSSRQQVERADDMWRAWKLFRAGMTYRDISRILECALGKAHSLVVDARAQITEQTAAEMRVEVTERQRAIIAKNWGNVRNPEHAKIIQASDKILMSLHGLEPAKHTTPDSDGAPRPAIEIRVIHPPAPDPHPHGNEDLDHASRVGGEAPEGSKA